VAVAGTASIPARELELKGTASLLNGPSEAPFVLPFAIQGPWEEPLFLADAQSLIRRSGATAPLLDALRDKKTRDAVRSALERLQGAPPRPSSGPDATSATGSQ
jgi:AsmA protein